MDYICTKKEKKTVEARVIVNAHPMRNYIQFIFVTVANDFFEIDAIYIRRVPNAFIYLYFVI